MFAQVFKNIDDILWKDAGCGSELDYIEQTSWLLFLKYLNDYELSKKKAAQLGGVYKPILKKQFRWDVWAAPKLKSGAMDHNKALTGDDLKRFVDGELFPHLKNFKNKGQEYNSLEYKIGEIFSELKNKIQSGRNLREVINQIDKLRFNSQAEQHEMSHLYEAKIKNMGNAGRNGGEYYTPRALIRSIVKVVGPQIGETVYDGAAGSAGFLCEAFEYLKPKKKSTRDLRRLQEKTFYGREKKSLAYIIGIMNMIFHGLEAPNIEHTNTLASSLSDIGPDDRHDVVLANPPFGGKERDEVKQNFPIQTGETAFLFLQHFIKILKARGRAGVVIKNTFLSNTDGASIRLRQHLIETCNLHTVLVMPRGTFTGAGVMTVVLFFTKGQATKKIWYYECDPGRSLGKTQPLNEQDLVEFLKLQKTFGSSDKSWLVDVKDVDTNTYDLSAKNPHAPEAPALRHPDEVVMHMKVLNNESNKILDKLKGLV